MWSSVTVVDAFLYLYIAVAAAAAAVADRSAPPGRDLNLVRARLRLARRVSPARTPVPAVLIT